MSYTIREESLQGTEGHSLVFEGALTIQHVMEIKQDIEQRINKTSPLHISLKKVTQLDLSFLQLLLALKKNYSSHGLSMQIHMELEQDLRQLIQISGFQQLIPSNISTP